MDSDLIFRHCTARRVLKMHSQNSIWLFLLFYICHPNLQSVVRTAWFVSELRRISLHCIVVCGWSPWRSITQRNDSTIQLRNIVQAIAYNGKMYLLWHGLPCTSSTISSHRNSSSVCIGTSGGNWQDTDRRRFVKGRGLRGNRCRQAKVSSDQITYSLFY